MANTFKFGDGNWATKKEATLAYNDENSNFKPLPFTFDRASSATVVNKQGLIETVGIDEPRIDFLNNTKGHLLLEPSRQNLITYSEDLTTGWNTSAATVTTNTQISPDGTQTADTITVTANSGGVYSYNITVTASTSYTFSFYVKRGTISDSETALAVRNQTASTFISQDISYSANADNWIRIEHTFTTPVGCTSIRLYPQRLSNGGQGTIFVWGAQLEEGSYATSYIPTQGSAVTRSAESCTGAGNSTVFNDSEGVLYAEIAALADDGTSRRISLSNGSTSNTVEILFQNTGTVSFQVKSGNSFQGGGTFNLTQTEFNKIAVKYKANDLALWVNGSERSTDTSANTPIGISELAFDNGGGGSDFYGKTKEIRVYNTALTDAELIQLTS